MARAKVYVLELEDNCYYVGQTVSMVRRFTEHREGKGALWTKIHKPVDIFLVREMTSDHEEQNLTIELMAKHGQSKVRGGRYSNPVLSEEDLKASQKDIWQFRGACFKCGSMDHLENTCPIPDLIGKMNALKPSCNRCGRDGHVGERCRARLSLDGKVLVNLNPGQIKERENKGFQRLYCDRCGRNNHTTEQCFAKLDVKPSGNSHSYQAKPSDKRNPLKSGCSRCGRNNHATDQCYAKIKTDGESSSNPKAAFSWVGW